MRNNRYNQNITRTDQNLFARIRAFIQQNVKHASIAVAIVLFLGAVYAFAQKGDVKSQAAATAMLPASEQVATVEAPVIDSIPAAEPVKEEVEPVEEAGKVIGSGHASYYGAEFAGRPTANGETFNPSALTAAHKTLPFGSKVKVTNLRNGESVVVRINDRGPFVAGRLIDLSKGAAQEIGMVSSGTANVKLELLS